MKIICPHLSTGGGGPAVNYHSTTNRSQDRTPANGFNSIGSSVLTFPSDGASSIGSPGSAACSSTFTAGKSMGSFAFVGKDMKSLGRLGMLALGGSGSRSGRVAGRGLVFGVLTGKLNLYDLIILDVESKEVRAGCDQNLLGWSIFNTRFKISMQNG